MSCSGCGTSDFGDKLGKCAACMRLALGSAILFWGLYFVLRRLVDSLFVQLPVLGFAALVTLVLLAHVLAFLSDRRRQARDGRPGDPAD